MSQEVRLQCADCARFVYVAGRAEDPYVCPVCRGAAVVESSGDLAAQLAAVTAERDEERRLRLLAADHAAEVQAGYQRDLTALRRAAREYLDARDSVRPSVEAAARRKLDALLTPRRTVAG